LFVKDTLESMTKINFTDVMLADVMKVLDPDHTNKVGVKMLKENIPKLSADDPKEKAKKPPPQEPVEVLPGTKPPRPPRRGEVIEVNVADRDAGEVESWLPAEVRHAMLFLAAPATDLPRFYLTVSIR
jgi:hypothetical protein